jgi:hypothetical protein
MTRKRLRNDTAMSQLIMPVLRISQSARSPSYCPKKRLALLMPNFRPRRTFSTRQSHPQWTPSSGAGEQASCAVAPAETMCDGERESVEGYALVGRDLGGGSGTLSTVMSGC